MSADDLIVSEARTGCWVATGGRAPRYYAIVMAGKALVVADYASPEDAIREAHPFASERDAAAALERLAVFVVSAGAGCPDLSRHVTLASARWAALALRERSRYSEIRDAWTRRVLS